MRYTSLSLEKPKVGEIQMNWLRSEDLKEEKVVNHPVATVPRGRSSKKLDCREFAGSVPGNALLGTHF
jgi:hypothetical protein